MSFFIAVFLLPTALIGYPFYTYKDDKVVSGSAYGFVIGESKSQTYERVLRLGERGKFETFEIGQGASAVPHDMGSPTEAFLSDHWRLVVDEDWWNNAIYLEFSGDALYEIRQFRVCCEVP